MLNVLQKPAVIFAPMPKSASNTLLERLAHTLDACVIKPKCGGGVGHFTINPRGLRPALKTLATRKTPLVYQHFLPTDYNRQALQNALNVGDKPKVIVSVRNIYDTVVSAERHQWRGYSPLWVSREENEFMTQDNEAANHGYFWHAVILMKFYAAWAIAHQTGAWNVKFVTYDEILNNPAACVDDVLKFYGITAAVPDNNALEKIVGNISPGKTKEETAELPQKYKDLIKDFAASFKGVDFGILGVTEQTAHLKKKAG